MLTLKKIKLLHLCPLFLAIVSCGKKVSESKSTEQGQTGATAASEITLETTREGSERANAVFSIPRSGDTYLTPTITAVTGNAAGYSLKVYMNRTTSGWEFYCLYKGVTSPSHNQFTLERCYDMDNLDLGLSPSNIHLFNFPLDKGKTVEMAMTGSSSTKTTARAVFRAEWRANSL